MNVSIPWRLLTAISIAIVCTGRPATAATPESIEQARNRMVTEDLVTGGITNTRVLQAMRATPRHEFVPAKLADKAYLDMSLPLGEHQTLTPPLLVAYMTEQLDPQPTDVVLEIGTGSGYQAAVLSPLVKEVYSIEIVEKLGKRAKQTLKKLNYENVFTKLGDGYQGWPEKAPFDKIIVTCSPENVPLPLIDQLKEGGRIIVPVGEPYQQVFHLLKKENGKLTNEALRPTLFVPMTGQAAKNRKVPADPLHPTITNPSFEESLPDSGEPTGWYYLRQVEILSGSDAPDGQHYATFSNREPGRMSRALQGFAIDGRKIRQLQISCMIKARDVSVGVAPDQLPQVAIIFLNENRAPAGNVAIGPWSGTFDWQQMVGKVKVPPTAREAIVNIGLIGATGEVSYDNIQVAIPSGDK